MAQSLQVLTAVRVTTILKALDDTRNLPANLVWSGRTKDVPAVDGEIMARWRNRIQIADLVADDQKAGVYSSGRLRLETTGIPNLKLGQMLTQEQIKQFESLNASGAAANDPNNFFSNMENGIIDGLLLGLRQRRESICVGRILDGFSYDRLGIKLNGVSWGTPADLKITPAHPWTDHTLGTPVTDILTAKEIGVVRYGIAYDRLTLPLSAFRHMIQCVEFQNLSKQFLMVGFSFANLAIQNTMQMMELAKNVLGLKFIETYDSRSWSQADDGSEGSTRFWPINKVALTDSAVDNDPSNADFAHGIPIEVAVASMIPGGGGMIGQLPKGTYGPIGYVTGEHNPPQLTYWGVDRGWSRKYRLQESAVLTVAPATGAGAIVDYIPTTEPAL